MIFIDTSSFLFNTILITYQKNIDWYIMKCLIGVTLMIFLKFDRLSWYISITIIDILFKYLYHFDNFSCLWLDKQI